MQIRLLRLRFRRRLRKGQQQVEDLGQQAEQQLEQNLYKRFGRLAPVKRFVAAWLGLMVLLIGLVLTQNLALSHYYQTVKTIPGGVYSEGVRGRFTNASPLFATSDADATVSRLLFAGLFRFNETGELVGDLAQGYTVDATGTTYTVQLKSGLQWHDGKPLTSADVVFTYQIIQNPDTLSPLLASWEGITVTAPNPQTVVFKLPGVLASFPYTMTNGIVPKHILANIPAADLRSADFNTVHPIGAGPFAWEAIEVKGNGDPRDAQQQIGLKAFEQYNAGSPKLQKFIVGIYANDAQLLEAFKKGELTALEGVSDIPSNVTDKESVVQHNLLLRAANMVFFKTSEGILSEQPVRKALVQASNVPAIVDKLDYATRTVQEPLLQGQLAYDSAYVQPAFNAQAARTTLDTAGWRVAKSGARQKDRKTLGFVLSAANTKESRLVAEQLRRQWAAVGVKVDIQFLDANEFQNAIKYHNYEAILNGISIGVDPDVFVYWDSSQADIRSNNRLNLSEYKNATADAALEAGRTRLDPSLRTIKYKPFLQAWQQDLPALGLYQPRILYITNGAVAGLQDQAINTATDRFNNVHNWQIREARVTN